MVGFPASITYAQSAGSLTQNAPLAETDMTLALRTTSAGPTEVASMVATATVTVAIGTSAAQLQHLIDTSAAGTTLQLQAGHYSFDRTITVNRDDIAVIGAGSDKTIIDVPKNLGAEAFHVGSGNVSGDFKLAADMAEGGKMMTLAGAHSLVAGDYIYIERASTTAFYDEIGDQSWRNTDVALRTSIVQVTAVNGSQITLASGVHFDFTRAETSIGEIKMAERVTLGGFSVDYGLGVANPSNFANTLANYSRNAVIEIEGTAGLRLFDVSAKNVPSLGVNVASSTGVSATGLTMTGAHNKGDGGNGYGLQIRDVYDSRFSAISDADMRHSVVFASWTSAVGNVVQVSQTDRDINFHGGRDHGNVVTVDNSIRDAASDIISPTLFVNTQGTHYGTVTDEGANTVTFGRVVGSRLGDKITGYDTGAWLDGKAGDDSLTGGAGNDLLIGGAGKDVLKGGGGQDIAQYAGRHADFTITRLAGDQFEVRDRAGIQGSDQVSAVEWLLFDDKAVHLTDMTVAPISAVAGLFGGVGTGSVGTGSVGTGSVGAGESPKPPKPVAGTDLLGTSGKNVFDVTKAGVTVQGLGDIDTVRASVSFTLGADVERLNLTGTAAIDGTGSAHNNHIYGNDATNVLQGMSGVDRLWGRGGDDQLFGGDGNDKIYGDAGRDVIDGGAGQDKLKGGAGADVFSFKSASDSARGQGDKVLDFKSGLDTIDLTAIDADTMMAGDQAFVWGRADADATSLWARNGWLYGDTNHDGIADLAIHVAGRFTDADILF